MVCSLYVEPPFSRIPLNSAFQKAAISKMHGVGGKPGWAWIFILEGLATIVAGFMSFWIIQDFPDSAKFLTNAERTVVIRRLQGDDQYSAAGEKFRMKYIWQSLSDLKTCLTGGESPLFLNSLIDRSSLPVLMFAGITAPLYAFSLFLPTIINQVSSEVTNSAPVPVFIPDYSLDTVPPPPTYSPSPSTSSLVS